MVIPGLHVGQVVFVTDDLGRVHGGRETVSRIGRAYFYTGNDWSERKFSLATGEESLRGGYIGGQAFSEEQWVEREAREKLLIILAKTFGIRESYPLRALSGLSLEQLRTVIDWLKESTS